MSSTHESMAHYVLDATDGLEYEQYAAVIDEVGDEYPDGSRIVRGDVGYTTLEIEDPQGLRGVRDYDEYRREEEAASVWSRRLNSPLPPLDIWMTQAWREAHEGGGGPEMRLHDVDDDAWDALRRAVERARAGV